MNLVERAERSRGEIAAEASKVEAKEGERAEAVRQVSELQGLLASKTEEVNSEKKKAADLEEKLSVASKALADEAKLVSSLREEVSKLQEGLKEEKGKAAEALETLEKVEKEAVITYKDAVEKYKKSEEFEELVNVKAGYLHEEGFNDCLAFVGVGNVIDPGVHTVQNFRARLLSEMGGQGGDAGP